MSTDTEDENEGALLFRAERDAAYYWFPYAIGVLAILPLSPLDPALAVGGLAVAAWVCAWSRQRFLFHLRTTHIALRGAPLDGVLRIGWAEVRAAEVSRAKRPWFGTASRGDVRLVLRDERRVRIPAVREPHAASAAVNAIVTRYAARTARTAA